MNEIGVEAMCHWLPTTQGHCQAIYAKRCLIAKSRTNLAGDCIVATEPNSLHLATKAIELAGRVDHALQVRGHPYLAPVYTSALELFGVLALRGAEELTCLNIRGLRSTQYKPWKLVAGRPHLDKAKRHPWDNSNPRPPL